MKDEKSSIFTITINGETYQMTVLMSVEEFTNMINHCNNKHDNNGHIINQSLLIPVKNGTLGISTKILNENVWSVVDSKLMPDFDSISDDGSARLFPKLQRCKYSSF